MKKYIKPFFLVLFNNVFLLMLDTPETCKNLWSLILFALLWFISFSMLVVGIRYTKLPKDSDSPKFIQKCANQPSLEEIENLNKNIRTIPVCKYQTNAEYIRSLSDEELVDMFRYTGSFVENGEPKLEIWLKEKQIIIDDSFGCILDWLQSEVD